MTRWPPDARERLETAALQLFAEHGYDNTTVAQIAERAGLNRATFFRYYADKREVLFGGEEVLGTLFTEGIRSAPVAATLVECLEAAFVAADVAMTPIQRAKAVQRVLVVVGSSEVQERGLLKHARLNAAIAAALLDRGADETTARLCAEVGMLAFAMAVELWTRSPEPAPFRVHAAAALTELVARAEALRSRPRHADAAHGNHMAVADRRPGKSTTSSVPRNRAVL